MSRHVRLSNGGVLCERDIRTVFILFLHVSELKLILRPNGAGSFFPVAFVRGLGRTLQVRLSLDFYHHAFPTQCICSHSHPCWSMFWPPSPPDFHQQRLHANICQEAADPVSLPEPFGYPSYFERQIAVVESRFDLFCCRIRYAGFAVETGLPRRNYKLGPRREDDSVREARLLVVFT